ncbi:hypothetical protein C0J52_11129 [Blattella germanica]|nr:hypothetical protein C0J52_11129 [Blattella germanica]
MIGERLSASGTRLNTSSPVQSGYHMPGNKSSTESVPRSSTGGLKSVSRQSLLDIRYFSSSRDSLAAAYVNRAAAVSSTASELDLSRKARRRDLRGRLKLPATVTLASSNCGNEPPLIGHWGQRGTSGGGPGGTVRATRMAIPRVMEETDISTVASDIILASGPVHRTGHSYLTLRAVCAIIGPWWFHLPSFTIFGSSSIADIVFHFRTGYLEDGVLQTDSTKLRHHYMNSTTFYIDCLCLLPLDFLYLSIGFNSILRSFRLVKIYRFWAFMDRTERHTNYPNLFRSTSLIHYLLVIFHWNGCLYHIIYKNNAFGSKNWVYGDSETADVVKQYLQSYYWCTLALTTIGDLPRPRSKFEYLFVIIQLLFGLLLFATVLGHVANIVTSVSAARKEFQGHIYILNRSNTTFISLNFFKKLYLNRTYTHHYTYSTSIFSTVLRHGMPSSVSNSHTAAFGLLQRYSFFSSFLWKQTYIVKRDGLPIFVISEHRITRKKLTTIIQCNIFQGIIIFIRYITNKK